MVGKQILLGCLVLVSGRGILFLETLFLGSLSKGDVIRTLHPDPAWIWLPSLGSLFVWNMGSGSSVSVIFILEKEKQLAEAKGATWMRPLTDML